MSSDFTKDQEREWINFLKKFGFEGTKNLKLYKDYGLRSFLPKINEVLSENSERIKLLRWVFWEYNSTPYSIERSMEVIIDTIKRLSKDFPKTGIPLVYTTLTLPSYVNYPSQIWRELFSIKTFKKEEYGHLEFLDALDKLRIEESIEIIFFDIIYVNNKNLTFKIIINCLKDPKKMGKEVNPISIELLFDIQKGCIMLGNKKCEIPRDTKQYDLCKIMFSKKMDERIDWTEIVDSWKGNSIGKYKGKENDFGSDEWREAYDAVNAVNKKVKVKLNIEKLFKYKDKTVRRLA